MKNTPNLQGLKIVLTFACSELLKKEILKAMNEILSRETSEHQKQVYGYIIKHLSNFLTANIYDYSIKNQQIINKNSQIKTKNK